MFLDRRCFFAQDSNYSTIDNGKRKRREGTTPLTFATKNYDNYLNDIFSAIFKINLDYNARINLIIK